MKMRRTNEDFGGGSGKGIFESSLFDVIVWFLKKGIKTTITIKPCNIEIHFEGDHKFISDKACLDQLSVVEIKKIISSCEKIAFENGKNSKAKEIRSCLNI